MKLQLGNAACRVMQFDNAAEEQLLSKSLMVQAPGYKFMKAYKSGRWDGLIRFYHANSQQFPSGFLSLLAKDWVGRGIPIEVEDKRYPHGERGEYTIPDWVHEKLRYYQVDGVLQVLNNRIEVGGQSFPWRRGTIKFPTGSGKSHLAIAIIETVDQPTLYLIERKRLLHQFAEQYEAFTGKVPGKVGDGILSLEKVTIVSVATMHMRLDDPKVRDYLNTVKLVIADECFVGETRISGPDGSKPIAEMRVGDRVYAYDHEQQQVVVSCVSRVFKKPCTVPLQKVTFHGGASSFVSTADHKVWNEEKGIYEPIRTAGVLLRTLWNGLGSELLAVVPYEGSEQNTVPRMPVREKQESCLRNNEQNKSEVCFSAYEEKQSNAQSSHQGKGVEHVVGNWSCSAHSGRQWQAYSLSTAATGQFAELAYRSYRTDERGQVFRLPDSLQTRYWEFPVYDWYRSGRPFAWLFAEASAGQEEDRLLGTTRVDHIEIYQPGRAESSSAVCVDGAVYDLEIAEYHNYFAEGVLVHNCHHASRERYTEIIKRCPVADMRLGMSGTPLSRGDIGDFTLIGTTGEMLAALDRAPLEEEGYLAKVKVKMLDMGYEGEFSGTYPQAYSALIVHNEERNHRIVRIACEEVEKYQSKVIVLVRYIEHGEVLQELFVQESRVRSVFIQGSTPSPRQAQVIRSVGQADELDVIIATGMLEEGVDIPQASVLINAASGMSEIKTIQRVGRIVRPKASGEFVKVYDFTDWGNEFLLKHSQARLRTYTQEKFHVLKSKTSVEV